MNYFYKNQHPRWTWILLLNLCFDFEMTRARDPRYFGGLVYVPKICAEDQVAGCQQLCPGDQLAVCDRINKKLASCSCHSAPETVSSIPCQKIATTEPGDVEKSTGKKLADNCLNKSKFFYRSRIDVYTCKASPLSFCVIKDYLEEIETMAPFGGKMVDNICAKVFEDICKGLCPGTFATCGGFGNLGKDGIACYCHMDSPTEVFKFSCTHGDDPVTPSDGPSDGTTIMNKCRDAAIGFNENIDFYTCIKPDYPIPACVLLNQLPEPTTTTTTTTEVPTTTTTTTTTTEEPTSTTTMETTEDPGSSFGGGGGSSLGGSGRVSCSICKGGFLLSFIVCPILCLIFQVIRVVVYLLKKTLFRAIKNLLNFVASTLDDVVGAIGGLLD